ncbi:MAG: hypothetical protein ACR2I1_03585 [Propionibacteriaceae bacterium]
MVRTSAPGWGGAQDVQIDRLAAKPLAHPILTEVLAVRTDQQREITSCWPN